ncbi:hypothetical protein [Maridesulfovibrio frigidus]|uniref:hypothetical protein n=1 Tax=Maridesulfovibrio frigidus TaxID=340956 RepID=UPI00146FB5E9|nr:hypothetical protein [Maridesulfovibrio frigidus]
MVFSPITIGLLSWAANLGKWGRVDLFMGAARWVVGVMGCSITYPVVAQGASLEA